MIIQKRLVCAHRLTENTTKPPKITTQQNRLGAVFVDGFRCISEFMIKAKPPAEVAA